MEKISYVGGHDPYKIPRKEGSDSIKLWPAITYIHIGMYLLLTPSPYSQEDLLNYKSLDCYRNFVAGWVMEVAVKQFQDKRVVIGKVSTGSSRVFGSTSFCVHDRE